MMLSAHLLCRRVIHTETEKLYSPLNFYLRDNDMLEKYNNNDYWRDDMPHYEASEFMDSIELFLRRDRDKLDKTRGMMEYYDSGTVDDKVVSLFPTIEEHDDNLWCVAELTLNEPLTHVEITELKDWWTGQLSDGWGESLEQREIKIDRGELYIEPWTSDGEFFIDTQKEFAERFGLDYLMSVESTTVEALSPAQMALNEPGIFDEDIDCVDTSTYMSMLTDRLNANFTDYIDKLRGMDDGGITDYTSEIARVSEAHYYLTERFNFHFSELDYLLKFKDPLMVVSEAFGTGIDKEHSAVMWKIFHEQDALKSGRHALAFDASAETAAPTAEALKQELFDRLDNNMLNFRKVMLSAGKETIFDSAEEIAAYYAAREYMKTAYDFKTGEVEFLLQFQDPLSLLADKWLAATDQFMTVSDVVAGVFEDKGSHGHYALVIDADNPAAKEKGREPESAEKQSVIKRIRDAGQEPKQPRRDKFSRDKSEPEH